MSVKVISWALDQQIPGTIKFTLMVLANFADEDGYCYPSQGRLAEIMGFSDRTVRRSLIELEDLGLIERQTRRRKNGCYLPDGFVLNTGHTISSRSAAEEEEEDADHRTNCPVGDSEENDDFEKTATGQKRHSHRTKTTQPPDKNDIAYNDEPSVEPSVETLSQREREKTASAASARDRGSGRGSDQGQPLDPEQEYDPGFEVETVRFAPELSREAALLEWEKFRAHYAATGERRHRWAMAWRKWLLGRVNFARGAENGSGNRAGAGRDGTGRGGAGGFAERVDSAWDTAFAAVEMERCDRQRGLAATANDDGGAEIGG